MAIGDKVHIGKSIDNVTSTSITDGLSANQGRVLKSQVDDKIGDVGKSLTTNGYQKLSNGLIIQWGTTALNTASLTTTFPIAFPTACFSISHSRIEGTNDYDGIKLTSISATSFTSVNINNDTKELWIAIGH